jgi:acetyl esterase
MSQNLALDNVIKQFVNALTKAGGKPIYELTPAQARDVLETVQKSSSKEIPATVEEKQIQTNDINSITFHIIRPANNAQKLPVVIYMHGGGWVMGSLQTHNRLVRQIANGAQVAIIFVDYTRAPEGQYPLAQEQGYAVAQWIDKNANSLNLDNSRMTIAGDSVGGLMATAIALMAIERGGPRFQKQILLYPVTDANFSTPSYQQFADGPWLTKKAMEWFWDNYVPDKSQRREPFASPLQATLDQLKKLPPTFLMTNEYDVLRDEGEAYAHKLMQAGVPTVAVRCLGTIHDCLLLNPLADSSTIQGILNEIIAEIKKNLS